MVPARSVSSTVLVLNVRKNFRTMESNHMQYMREFLVLNVCKKNFISDVRIVSSMMRSFKKKTRIQKSKSFPVKPLPAVYTDFFPEKKLSRLNLRIGTKQLLIFSW